MENTGWWPPQTNASLEEALSGVKRHLRLDGNGEHDEFLVDLLRRRLTYQDGQYVWPREVRSALVHWTMGADN